MPDITTLAIWTAAVFVMCWMVNVLVKHVESHSKGAAQSHMLAVLERERCQAILDQCREMRSECGIAASAAYDAAADAEEFAESVEPLDNPFDDDEDDAEAWRG